VATLRGTKSRIAAKGVGDPEAIYKVAQAFALLGDKKSALRLVGRSVENGFFPCPYLARDPLLASLRDDPELARLLELAQKRHESFRSAFF